MSEKSLFETTAVALDQGGQSWTLLSEQVNRLIEAWEQATAGQRAAPALSEFAISSGSVLIDGEILREMIKVDLEYRWSSGQQPRRIDDYIVEFPSLALAVTADLLLEECLLRRKAGERVDLEDYRRRYPECASGLERMWTEHDPQTDSATRAHIARRSLESYAPGDSVDDFDLLTLLGTGAFARVFLARQRSMQRLVALKLSANRSREPQTLARLDHDHIVRVFDQRLLDEQRLRLLYMQYVPGGTLQAVVPLVRDTPRSARSGALLVQAVRAALDSRGEGDRLASAWAESAANIPWADVVSRLGMQLARALDSAHRQGVLHRDIKPANVLLSGDGSPKLADFNISFSESASGSTPAAYFGGSLAYMSPEQLEACHPDYSRVPESLDARSDLYSLAVLLWEVLHGERPFVDDRVAANWSETVNRMIADRRAGWPRSQQAPLPDGDHQVPLEIVLRQGLSPEPDDRFSSGAEFARRLEICRDDRAWALLGGHDTGWRRLLRRFPKTAALSGVLLPNLVATAFNIWYNGTEVVPAEAQNAFWTTLTAVNCVAYPIGVAWALERVKGVFPAVRQGRPGDSAIRRRALMGGINAGAVCLTLWVLAGFVYPLVLSRYSSTFPWTKGLHFLISLTLCGLVSAVYPFFMVSWVSVKMLYPSLINLSDPTLEQDAPALRNVRQWCDIGVMLAAAVPLLAVIVLSVAVSQARGALISAAAAGLAGFVAAFIACKDVREDLTTLIQIVRPGDR